MSFKVSGVVKKLNVDVGDHVTKGELIAQIEPSPFQAKVNQAQANVDAARAAVAAYVGYLGAAVVSYIHVLDPDLVVLGGGIMHAADQILPPVQRYVQEHVWACPPRTIPVRAAILGDAAALVGAAALARGEGQFL